MDDTGSSADFRTLQGALNYVMQNLSKTEAATITVNNGTYNELLYLRNKDNLTIVGESRAGTLIQYQNSEALNPGSSGRPVFLVELADLLTLENLTLKNTTIKTASGGQAEAIYFNSTGRLVAKNANFISEQDTLQLKGYSWFYRSLVAGNVDFIWGNNNVSLFEESEIRSLGDSSNATNGGYVVQARTLTAADKGFVFLNSNLTQGPGPTGNTIPAGATYLARSPGGTSTWDNVVFINSRMDTHINAAGWAGAGVNGQPAPNPGTATATTGWREFATMNANGDSISLASRVGGYELSLGEVASEYCNRAQIFAAYNSSAGWNPLPEDSTDCANYGVSSSSSAASSTGESSSESSTSSSAASSASSDASSESSAALSSVPEGEGSSSSSSSSSSAAPAWTAAALDLFGTSTSLPEGVVNSQSASALTLTSKGGSVNTSNRKFFFAHQSVTGDFVFTARLASVAVANAGAFTVANNNQFRYGLLVTESIAPAASYPALGRFAELGFYTLSTTPTYQASRAFKLDMGGATTQSRSNGTWAVGDYLRITRTGNSFQLATSSDGVNYTVANTSAFADANNNPIASEVKLGFFSASGADELVLAFDNISISQ